MNDKKVRVRFAPSPTGPLHMGGVRTALFNYLFARKHNGDFLLRIEDTDQTRYVPGAEEYIAESLKWCGIQIDEGATVGGEYGPYRQSERKPMYREYADQLIASGNAYYAFDTPEELEAIRNQHEEEKKTFTYNYATRENLNNSLALSEEEVQNKIEAGEAYVVRFKMPVGEELQLDDEIRGRVVFNTSALDDKVLFKSDGMPTYHLANVVDDYLMKITHVIRGEEWLPSMPLHVLLYRSFGWKDDMPKFAHLPLILKPVGKGKLSKRDGDKLGFPVFPLEWTDPKTNEVSSGYREGGYFPEAFINMLAFLGWNPGTEQEIFSMEELSQAFSLERVGKSGSKFDPEKTKWFNRQYLMTKSDEEIGILFAEQILKAKGIDADQETVNRVCGMVKDRVDFVSELWEHVNYFFEAPVEFDAKTVKKGWKEDTPALVTELKGILEGIEDFSSANSEEIVKEWITAKEIGFGKVMNPFRLAVVGAGKGPHMFDIIEILGKKETIARLDYAMENIKK
ncbi:glutamate--tRNA ligase [Labilibaculum euxinus]|uniref:Glutamate--tRNA ligase n=1 Tax=Labilibaculum euxinus TaxID=2686357 RepID=A0A7M4D3V9_9BACT|nr:glutamate--tRNA ligase [Labilibaculum euxinus]MUP37338.1 glutamate--tRNA ligase [Labilibaculum euxinus]MVB06543.1 glutamate--tRNA ligase [Labilibaculum euxinus]